MTLTATAAAAGSLLAAFAPAQARAPQALDPEVGAAARALAEGGEVARDPALADLARRLDPALQSALAGRTPGWEVLDLNEAPDLGFGPLTPLEAQRLNTFVPGAGANGDGAVPFILRAQGAERQRALLCLTQAIYYEAATEPTEGQEAVAQTVLNRVRNPAFPKSICGVVYQGAQAPGCQFTFACDGSRARWKPEAPYWQRAQQVAEQALDGFVMKDVGLATSYHADYVFPAWGPTLVKIGQIGAHIFYRFPGPLGEPGSFDGRYVGRELSVNMSGPSPAVLAALEAARHGAAPQNPTAPLETYTAIDPTAPGGVRTRVAGQIIFGRRVPTHDEIARINDTLAAMGGSPAAAATSPPAFTPVAPKIVYAPPAS
ncbi:MAG TPA: cell wall hydrolase [Caulobacteraceae bacterium]|nr:cell wall hydrolase [Caulobacteraceae bacterium]